MNTKRILLTGARAPVTVHILRTLRAAGHSVVLTDSTPLVIAKKCKEGEKFYLTSAPNDHPVKYMDELKKIIEREKVELVIPLCEEVFFISRYREMLETDVFVDSFEKMELVHHKAKFCQWLAKEGLDTPKSMLANNEADVQRFIAASEKQRFILKRPYTRFSNYIHILEKGEGLDDLTYPIVIQEFIKGREWCTYSIAVKDGLTTVLYPSDIHYGQGTTIYYEQIDHEALTGAVNQAIGLLGWKGQIAFDLIECEETGKFYFIECNPRATSGALFVHADAWFKASSPIAAAYQMAPLMLWKIANRPSAELVRKFRIAQDIVGFSSGIRPFFAQFTVLAGWFFIAKKYGCTLTEATTKDIEWNGENLP